VTKRNELDSFLDRKVKEYRKQGKSEAWINGMKSAFNKYRSDKPKKEKAICP